MKKFFLHFALLLAFKAMLNAQSETLVNKTWEHSFGAPNDYEWASSILDNAGNLLTTGHTTLDDTNTELLLIKQDPDGNVLWQQAFQTAQNTKNGGVALAVDESDNIYIAGVTSTSGNLNDFNFLVLRYNSGGTKIWHQVFNGTGNGTDVPTAIIADNSRAYVCGASKGSTTNMDYWALRLTSSNGSLEWQKRYDYAGLDDLPANMAVDALGNVVLTGSSAASALNWEVATVKYASSNGTLLNENRVPNDGSLGLTKPSAIAKDASGNFIISGIKTTNGTDFDIRTIKLSSSLGVTWVQDYDSGAKVDSVSAVICDASGGIALTGWSSTQQGGSDFLTLKYESDGTLGWTGKWTVNPQDVLSKGRAVAIDANENVVVAGDTKGSMIVTGYSASGEVAWEKEIRKENTQSNRPLGLLLNQGGEIFLTSILRNQAGKSYNTYKINTLVRPQTPVLDSLGEPSHLEKEIIVRFKPDVVKASFIDNTNVRYGSLEEILKDTSCLRTIGDKISENNIGDWVAVKIHRNMTTADSVATTSLGNSIKVPDFYNTFVLLVPEAYRTLTEQAISDTLESDDLKCGIRDAELNRVVQTLQCEPDDPKYSEQYNLHPDSNFPNAHINVESAWCDGATGNASIKVAVIDTGVRWPHEDFGDGTFSGSVISNGFIYSSNAPLSSDPNNDNVNGHGTKVSGIIGAIRNNATGIAGIAGGSGSADGIRLIGLKTGLAASSLSNIIEAMSDAVDDYNAQVINCSFGFSPYEYPVESAEMRKKLHYVNRMGAIVCAGRGNIGQSGGDTDPVFPGTSQDEWVLCVGGTSSTGNYSGLAKHGDVIDLAAPAESAIVPTTGNTADNAYTTFSGTSSSTAHASGAAALLVGYALPTQLVQEDIEYILQASATDVDVPPAGAGYDGYTGFGKIDVGAAIAMIDKEHCVVSHFGTDVNANTKTSELAEESITLYIWDNFTTESGQIFAAGNYTADVYKVTANVTHSLPPGYSITDYWERHSSSTVFKHYVTNPSTGSKSLQPVEHVTITGTPTSTTATLEGYVYYLKNGNCSVQGWIPASPQTAELTYSLIACDGTVSTDEAVSESLSIAPNPVSEQLTVTIPDNVTGSYFSLSVYDLDGKEVLSIKDLAKWNGEKSFQLDVSGLLQGMYSVTLISESEVFSTKFIKI